MLAYIIRRVLYMVPTILAVALLVFLLFHEVGEDPVRVALGPHASPEKIAALEAKRNHGIGGRITNKMTEVMDGAPGTPLA